jgi:orotidine-5'-phosphate decarboxylase
MPRRFTDEQIQAALARIILAIDLTDRDKITRIAEAVRLHIGGYKVGPIVAWAELLGFVRDAFHCPERAANPAFQMGDTKVAETPNTAAETATVLTNRRYRFMTITAESGLEAMIAARKAAEELTPPLELLAIGVLTSHTVETLARVGTRVDSVQVLMEDRIGLAWQAGIHGAVCSALEVAFLRERFSCLTLVVPGTTTGAAQSGQKRTATPAQAMRDGADYLVVGREVLNAPDPVAALFAFANNMCEGMFPEVEDVPDPTPDLPEAPSSSR